MFEPLFPSTQKWRERFLPGNYNFMFQEEQERALAYARAAERHPNDPRFNSTEHHMGLFEDHFNKIGQWPAGLTPTQRHPWSPKGPADARLTGPKGMEPTPAHAAFGGLRDQSNQYGVANPANHPLGLSSQPVDSITQKEATLFQSSRPQPPYRALLPGRFQNQNQQELESTKPQNQSISPVVPPNSSSQTYRGHQSIGNIADRIVTQSDPRSPSNFVSPVSKRSQDGDNPPNQNEKEKEKEKEEADKENECISLKRQIGAEKIKQQSLDKETNESRKSFHRILTICFSKIEKLNFLNKEIDKLEKSPFIPNFPIENTENEKDKNKGKGG